MMNAPCIRAADMAPVMVAPGSVSAIRIGEEFYVIKVTFTVH